MSTKKKTLKEIPITGKFIEEVPVTFDLRLAISKTGLQDPGTFTTVFTVPSDYIYRLTDLYPIVRNNLLECYIEILDSSGNSLYMCPMGALLPDGLNHMENQIKLLEGDYIRFWYRSNDVLGNLTVAIMGVLEFNTLKTR